MSGTIFASGGRNDAPKFICSLHRPSRRSTPIVALIIPAPVQPLLDPSDGPCVLVIAFCVLAQRPRVSPAAKDDCRSKLLHHMQTSGLHLTSRADNVDIQMLADTATISCDEYPYEEPI